METQVGEIPKSKEYQILKYKYIREALKTNIVELVNNSEDVDAIFFLDKGARPLAHLYRKVYASFFPNSKLPQIRFLNIGREKLGELYQDIDIGEGGSLENITKSDLESRFGEKNISDLEKIIKIPGKNKVVVDDFADSGNTFKLAQILTRVLDPGVLYKGFIFLTPEEISAWGMPHKWHEGTLVSDSTLNAFQTKRGNPDLRIHGLQLRKELNQIAWEIAAERKN